MAFGGRAMLALLVLLGVHSATAVQYTVGGNVGWTLQSGANANSFYDDSFKNITLVVGDILLFPYDAPQHNVYEIPPSDLAACNFSNPIQTFTVSNATVTLSSAGVHAFACEVPEHCSQFGMQFSVTVGGATPTVAPVTAPVTSPTPAPATNAPVPAASTPVPAPARRTPSPAPITKAPAPSTKAPAPSASTPTGSVPTTEAPAPSGTGGNAGSIISSGSAMGVAAIVAGFAFLLV